MLSQIRKLPYIIKDEYKFGKNILSLIFGAGLAQLITLTSSLYLTHLYSPQDFGIFAFFISLYSLISVFTTGRYSLAISFSKNDQEAINIVALSLGIAFFVCSFFLIIFSIIENFLFLNFIPSLIQRNYGLLIAGTFINSLIQVFTTWLNRKKNFRDLYLLQIIQASIAAFLAIILGILHIKSLGLIYSFLIAQFSSVCYLIYSNRDDYKKLRLINYNQIKKMGRKFINFPIYSILADFINNFSMHLPIFLLSNFYGDAIVGFFSLANRILGVPNTLLASSISEVFKQRAIEDRSKFGTCQHIFIKVFFFLLFIGALILVGTVIFSPYIFPLLFGKQWASSGYYAQALAFLYFIKFIASPLSVTLYIQNKQSTDLYFHIILLLIVFLTMSTLHGLGFSAFIAICGMVLSFLISYSGYIYLSYRYSCYTTDLKKHSL